MKRLPFLQNSYCVDDTDGDSGSGQALLKYLYISCYPSTTPTNQLLLPLPPLFIPKPHSKMSQSEPREKGVADVSVSSPSLVPAPKCC